MANLSVNKRNAEWPAILKTILREDVEVGAKRFGHCGVGDRRTERRDSEPAVKRVASSHFDQ